MHFTIIKVAPKQQASIMASCFIFLSLITFAHSVERRNYNHDHDEPPSAGHPQHNRQHLSRSNVDQQSQDKPSSQDNSQDSDRQTYSTDSYDTSESDGSSEVSDFDPMFVPPCDLEFFRLNDTSVVVHWDIKETALERLGSFRIQYKSTKKDAEWRTDPREIPPTTRCIQINGLRPGNYFFIVAAVYDNDDSVSSKQYKFRLRARSKMSANDLPEQTAPMINWHEAAADFIRFKWKYTSKEKDMPWYGYLVYYRSAHTMTDFIIHRTQYESVELAELEPDTPYEAKIVAYNNNGASEFSELMRVKTKPNVTVAENTTSTVPTTKKPNLSTITPESTSSPTPSVSGSTPVLASSTTPRPPSNYNPVDKPDRDGSSSSSLSVHLHFVFEFMFGSQIDSASGIKYTLLIMVPIIFIVSFVVCLLSCHQRRKPSPSSSTSDSMESCDLEINGYFKNSFPGVDLNKDYPAMTDHHAHHGFVNNHPHIHDYA